MGELSRQEARLRLVVNRDDVDRISGELWHLGTLGIEEQLDGDDVILLAGFDSAVAADEAATQLGRFAIVEEFGSGDYLDTWREFATVYRKRHGLVTSPMAPSSFFGSTLGAHSALEVIHLLNSP